VSTHALRSDAQRNLARILEAARDVFAERGLEASVAEVASRAGVGTATIFRRFPTKAELAAAVFEQRMEELLHVAREQAASGRPDALRRFMRTAAETLVRDRAICEAAGSAAFASGRLAELKHELELAVRTLLKQAQADGHVRSDLRPDDIPVLITSVAQAAQLNGSTRWRRYLEIVLDGLRPAV
jgi:AcrR family transcriptional regulator